MNKKYFLIFSTAVIAVILDQFTKFLVRRNFQLNDSFAVINKFLYLTYVTNTGTAFGLFKGVNAVFVFISFAVLIFIFYFMMQIQENDRLMQLSLGLLLAGTLGNLIDRLAYGHVIDFIDFRFWPVFNVADSAVSVSIIILIILLWKKK